MKKENIAWEEFYPTFLQINPKNYTYKEALKIIIPYFEYILLQDRDYRYSYDDGIMSIVLDETKMTKYYEQIFKTFSEFEEINKFIHFLVISKYVKDVKQTYFLDELKTEMELFNTELKYYYTKFCCDDANRYESHETSGFNPDKSYKIFISFLETFFKRTNEANINLIVNTFNKSLEEKEKSKINDLEKNFQEWFKTTLIEEKLVF